MTPPLEPEDRYDPVEAQILLARERVEVQKAHLAETKDSKRYLIWLLCVNAAHTGLAVAPSVTEHLPKASAILLAFIGGLTTVLLLVRRRGPDA